MYLCQVKSKGQAEGSTPFEHVSIRGYPENFEREKRRERERRMFRNETTQDIPIGLLTEIRSVRVSSSFDPLSLSLSLRSPPPPPVSALSVLGTITPWGVCIRLRLARGTSTASGAAAVPPLLLLLLKPCTILFLLSRLPSFLRTVNTQPFSRSRHPSLSSLHG